MSKNFNVIEVAANKSSAMETRDHLLNGVSPKNQMSRRNFKFSFMLIALLAFSVSAFAQGGTTGPLTWNLNNGTLTISGTGAMPNYEYGNHPAPWYEHRESIHTVVVETGVTSIGNGSFEECANSTSITIPNSVIAIGNRSFYWCLSLTSMTIPDGVTAIGDWTFGYCTSLASVPYLTV